MAMSSSRYTDFDVITATDAMIMGIFFAVAVVVGIGFIAWRPIDSFNPESVRFALADLRSEEAWMSSFETALDGYTEFYVKTDGKDVKATTVFFVADMVREASDHCMEIREKYNRAVDGRGSWVLARNMLIPQVPTKFCQPFDIEPTGL